MVNIFSEWLDSPGCHGDLIPIARKVIWRAERIGIELDDAYFKDDHKECIAAVASNLWIFLKEESEALAKKASALLNSGDSEGLSRLVVQEFIDNCIDERRNDSPFHAYYRHMRDVLHDSPGINYKPISRQGSYYAWSNAKTLTLIPEKDHDFCSRYLDYSKWDACSVAFSRLHQKPEMISLSKHYWDEAIRIIVDEYFLSIRGLVSFVACKYPLIPVIEYDADTDTENEESSRKLGETVVSPEQQLPVIPAKIVEVDLELIARDCAAKLTIEEKIIISRMDSDTGAEIAKALGKKGASNVDYYKKPALDKVKGHWKHWSQPDSEYFSVTVDECRIFIRFLVDFCKGAIDVREYEKEGRP